MVQVIQLHPYKDGYPFGLQKDNQCTYVEYIKQITSETQLNSYRNNLILFKSIESQLIIQLDSYVKDNNQLQLYYQYQPLSIKSYIQDKLVLISQDNLRDKFLTKIITNINISIQQIIHLLISYKIQALLSIQNIAINYQQKIKFFIQPDFQYVQKANLNQLNQYYNTEKKKLQIQLQQFLQHIFSFTNKKPKDQKKANFVIQGTKLVFVNDQQSNRQSNMSNLSNNLMKQELNSSNQSNNQNKNSNNQTNFSNNQMNLSNQQKIQKQKIQKQKIQKQKQMNPLPQYMLKQPKQSHRQMNKEEYKQLGSRQFKQLGSRQYKQYKQLSSKEIQDNNNSKQKFDIKNILDQKKIQKNQSNNSHTYNKQPNTNNSSNTPVSYQQQSNYNPSNQQNKQLFDAQNKQVKNYFQNNDDFNKDASFYPEQFIKQDSIAQFQGYEDQLQKQLQDLKKIKYQSQVQNNTSKNRLSMVPNSIPINTNQFIQKQKSNPLNNSNNSSQNPHNTSNLSNKNIQQGLTKPNANNLSQNSIQSSTSNKYPSSQNPSNSQQQDTSTEIQKQKKKYKVTITTSHQVDVDDGDIDLKDIQKQIIQDIKQGKLKSNVQNNKPSNISNNLTKNNSQKQYCLNSNSQSVPTHLLKGSNNRETHISNSSHELIQGNNSTNNSTYSQYSQKPSFSNNNNINLSSEDYHSQDKPFSKQHAHINSQTGQYIYSNKEPKDIQKDTVYNSGTFAHSGNLTSTSSHQAPDIKKIIQKIKNNSQNPQLISNQNSNSNQQSNNSNTLYSQQQPTGFSQSQPTMIQKISQQQLSSQSSGQNSQNQYQSQNIIQKQQQLQQQTRPHSNLSSAATMSKQGQGTDGKSQQQQYDKQYYEKIQKAKMKAQQIMKLVKDRKAQ